MRLIGLDVELRDDVLFEGFKDPKYRPRAAARGNGGSRLSRAQERRGFFSYATIEPGSRRLPDGAGGARCRINAAARDR